MWQDAKNIYHFFQGVLAVAMYRFPARGMTVIGVTGTDGKTTTSSLIYHLLIKAGKKAALISSAGALMNGKASDVGLHVTTPGRFALQSYLQRAKKEGVEYVVLEVTSHALHQHRVFGVPFAIGVLTNVNREHLDYHKTWEKYVHAKAKLLQAAHTVILNKDDRSYDRIKKYELKSKDKKVITYGMKKDSDVNPHKFHFTSKLIGKFNEYNCLAAIAALQQLHIPDDVIRKGLTSFTAPKGRQEIVYNKQFMVVNDFAHTPQSFMSILPEMKKLTKNRLVHVFGAAALRDTYKRPEMGKLSSEYTDIIVLTSEDPRSEPIEKINTEITKGIKRELSDYKGTKVVKGKRYLFIIPDRKEAITFAISLAQRGDVILLTGKGNEKSMNYGRGEQPWNETDIALTAIKHNEKK